VRNDWSANRLYWQYMLGIFAMRMSVRPSVCRSH